MLSEVALDTGRRTDLSVLETESVKDGSQGPRFGPGLLVVGVGRSGTSVATQLAATLGLRPPNEEDLMPANQANPTGYWESSSLAAFNDKLLARWDSTWWTPPSFVDAAKVEELVPELSRARHAFRVLFGSYPGWVWKDPRLTALLPFWERAIGANPVLVPYRDPGATAYSIAVCDGLDIRQSLAVWERHTRLLLRSLLGRRVLVTHYDGLLSDPNGWREELYAFCTEAGLAVTPATQPADKILIRPKNCRESALNRRQQELSDLVKSVEGSNSEFPDLNLPDPSPDLDEMLNGIKLPSWLPARALTN